MKSLRRLVLTIVLAVTVSATPARAQCPETCADFFYWVFFWCYISGGEFAGGYCVEDWPCAWGQAWCCYGDC
jgi:hypothetical protein